jgi:hypothetical protein
MEQGNEKQFGRTVCPETLEQIYMSPTELYQKARVPNKILQLEAKSGD